MGANLSDYMEKQGTSNFNRWRLENECMKRKVVLWKVISHHIGLILMDIWKSAKPLLLRSLAGLEVNIFRMIISNGTIRCTLINTV